MQARTPSRGRLARHPGLAIGCLALVGPIAVLLLGEWLARSRGFAPFRPEPVALTVEPGGSLFIRHPTLGYAHRPGRYTIEFPTGYRFRVTHDARGLRITSPPGRASDPRRREIWIFGDSFTHGWSVDDEATYPWQVQQSRPRERVVNFGVSGYGTVHALLQLREELATGSRPAVVVLAYNFFHPSRNTFSRGRRKEVAPWNRLGPLDQPRATLDPDGALSIALAPVEYREPPLLRHSALVHALEITWNRLDELRLRSHEVTRALIREFVDCAASEGITVVFVTLEAHPSNASMVAFARQLGADATDISLDLRVAAHNNLPHDGHPSALAHRRYAHRLLPLLERAVTRP